MAHTEHDIFENRRQFQLERIILFSDAVFAIAITLLIIEIKVPHFDAHPTQQQLADGLWEKLPDFIGFIISFAVIGQFWTSHHRMFGYVKDFNAGLLWLNLFMLFWVVLMPFSTYLNMQYGNLDIVWFWYSMNLALIELSIYFLWKYIGKHKHLSVISNDKEYMRFAYRRSFLVLLIFLAGAVLTLMPWLWMKWISRFMFFFIFPVLSYARRKYEKNKKPVQTG
ncbi:MAG: TMEM175 family protein [Ferruginibacter sp.]